MEIDELDVSRSKELNSMGLSLSNADKNQNAIKYFNKSIQIDSEFFEPQYNKVKAFISSGKFDEAIDCLNGIIQEDEKQGEAYYLKANILFFYENKVEEAIELYNKAIYLGQKNENIFFNLGLCMFSCGQIELALKWIERAENINAKRIDILLKKGEVLMALERYEDAIITYNTILMQQVDNQDAYHFKAIVFAQLKNYEDALAILDTGEEITGANSIFEFDRALIYENMQDISEALYYIDRALKFDEQNIVALLKKGYLLSMSSDYDRAKKIFDFISKIDPNNFEGIFNKANLHMLLKEYKEAYEIYDFILENSQDNNQFCIYSYYFKSFSLKQLGEVEASQKSYQTALVFYSALSLKYSQDVQLMLLKGNTLRDIGKYVEAEEVYQYILELNSGLGDVHIMRAKNFFYMSEIEKAKEELKCALSINAGFLEVIQLDDDLKECL